MGRQRKMGRFMGCTERKKRKGKGSVGEMEKSSWKEAEKLEEKDCWEMLKIVREVKERNRREKLKWRIREELKKRIGWKIPKRVVVKIEATKGQR